MRTGNTHWCLAVADHCFVTGFFFEIQRPEGTTIKLIPHLGYNEKQWWDLHCTESRGLMINFNNDSICITIPGCQYDLPRFAMLKSNVQFSSIDTIDSLLFQTSFNRYMSPGRPTC